MMTHLASSKGGILFDEELGLQPTTSSNSSADEEAARLGDLCVKIKKQAYMHKLAGYHYESRYFLIGFLPSVSLTLACAIVALFTKTQSRVTGMLAMLAVFSQALTKHLNHKNSQAQVHNFAANAMQNISQDVTRLQASIQPLHNDSVGIDKSLLFLERKKSAQDRFEQARDGIDSNIPIEITAAFGLLESKLLRTQAPDGTIFDYARFNIAYELLFNVFCNTWLWRLKLPSSRWAVSKVLREMKDMRYMGDDVSLNPIPIGKRTLNEDEAAIIAPFDQSDQSRSILLSDAISNPSNAEENISSSRTMRSAQLPTSDDSNAGLSGLLSDILRDESSTVNIESNRKLPVIHPSRKLSRDPGSEEVVSTPISMSKTAKTRKVNIEIHDDPGVTAVVAAVEKVASKNIDYETDNDDIILDEALKTDHKEVVASEFTNAQSAGENGIPIMKMLTDIIYGSRSGTNKAGIESSSPMSAKTTNSSVGISMKKDVDPVNSTSSTMAYPVRTTPGEQQILGSPPIFRRTTPPRPPKPPTSAVSKKNLSEDEWGILQDSSLPKTLARKLTSPGDPDTFGQERKAPPATPSSIFLSGNGQSCSVSEISVSRSLDQNTDIANAHGANGSKASDSQSSKIYMYSRGLEAQLDSLMDNYSTSEQSSSQKQNVSALRALTAILDTSEKTMIFTRQRSSSSGCVSSSTSLSKGENAPPPSEGEGSRDQTPEVLHKFQQQVNLSLQLKDHDVETKKSSIVSTPPKEGSRLYSVKRNPQGQLKPAITNSPQSSIDGHIVVKSGTSFVSSLECPSYDASIDKFPTKLAPDIPSAPSDNNYQSDAPSLASAVGVLSPIVAKAKNMVLANLRPRQKSSLEVEDYKELNSVSLAEGSI